VPDFPRKAWFYIAGIILSGAGLAAWQLWGRELSSSFLLAWAILAILALLCQLYEIQLIPGHATSAAIGVGVGAVLIGGPKLGVAVVLVSTLIAELYLRRNFLHKDPLRYVAVVGFNVSQLLISVVIAGLVLQGLGGKSPPYETIVDFLRAGLVFAVFYYIKCSHCFRCGAFFPRSELLDPPKGDPPGPLRPDFLPGNPGHPYRPHLRPFALVHDPHA